MEIIVTLVGILVCVAGVVIAAIPKGFVDWIESIDSNVRFWSAILSRVAIGTAFLIAAPNCRLPIVVDVVGVLLLIAAFGIFVIGRVRLDYILAWFLGRPTTFLRAGSIAALGFGGLLIYAGA